MQQLAVGDNLKGAAARREARIHRALHVGVRLGDGGREFVEVAVIAS